MNWMNFRKVRRLSTPLSLALLALAGWLLPQAARAQVQFTGVTTTIGSGGYNQPADIAVDSSGNAYAIVFGGNQQLKETLQPDGSYVETNLTTGLAFPWGIALDAKGNVFIPSSFSNSVVQLRPSGSTYVQTTLNLNASVSPSGIAVGQNGTLYVASVGANAVYKETLHGSAYTQTPIVTGLGSGGPYGVAVDANGIVYIADTGDNQVLVETPWGLGYTQTTLSSGLSSPYGVAVDSQGNVYIADSGNNRILKETPSGGGAFTESTLGAGLSNPQGLSTDSNGNLYIANNGGGSFVELHIASVPFGSQAVRSAGKTIALPFTISAGTTIGSVSVLTTGTAGMDFVDAGGSTCTAQTYNSDTTCVVNVNLSPLSPGLRHGAVVLSDGSGTVLSTVPLFGTGTGPQAAYALGSFSTVGTGLSLPATMTVDDAGNVYIPDANNGNVVKVPPVGPQTTVGSGLTQPAGVAVDGQGNVYIADIINQAVYRVTPAGVQTQIGTGYIKPYDVAVDVSGNVYITDLPAGLIYKVTPAGVQTTVGPGTYLPVGLTTDAAGNVYFTDVLGGKVYELTPGGTLKTIAKGFYEPASVVIDAAGNLYVADLGLDELFELRPGGTPTVIVAGSYDPYGVALDTSGNLFFSDFNSSSVIRIARATPPAFSFAETLGGQTSTDSPKTASVQNIGNAPLAFSGISYPIDFPRDTSVGNYCRATTQLAIGASCGISVNFAPVTPITGGNLTALLSESVSITTNTLNTPGTIQSLSVSGTEDLNVTATPAFSVPGGTYNSAQSLTLTDTTPGATIYYSTNGKAPTAATGIKYTGPIAVRGTATIQAVAYAPGFLPGSVAAASYSFTVADPLLSLGPGSYSGAQSVTITTATPTATIYYTTNGLTPSANSTGSTKYTGSITVSSSETLKVIALQTGFTPSNVVQAAYTITP